MTGRGGGPAAGHPRRRAPAARYGVSAAAAVAVAAPGAGGDAGGVDDGDLLLLQPVDREGGAEPAAGELALDAELDLPRFLGLAVVAGDQGRRRRERLAVVGVERQRLGGGEERADEG